MNKALVNLKRQLRKDMAVKLEQITATELNRQCNLFYKEKGLVFGTHILHTQLSRSFKSCNSSSNSKPQKTSVFTLACLLVK